MKTHRERPPQSLEVFHNISIPQEKAGKGIYAL